MRKRVYCLYRVSTKGQVEKDDIPMQKQRCHEFAKEKDWVIVQEFSERASLVLRFLQKTGTLFRKSSATLPRASLMSFWFSCLIAWAVRKMKLLLL